MNRRDKVNKLASLLDRKNLATLKGERAANPRIHKVLFWMEQERLAGRSPEKYLDEALESYADVPKHRRLVRESVLTNFERLREFGSDTAAELEKMHHGRSPTILGPEFAGESIEVDHIISFRDAPELAHEFANFRLEPKSVNRAKSKKLEPSALSLAKRLTKANVLSGERLTALNAKSKRSGSRKAVATSAPSARPSSVSSPISSESGMTDPRIIVTQVTDLLGSFQDWERRIAAVVENANYVKLHACELVNRTEVRKNHAIGQLNSDASALENLLNDTAKFGQRTHTATTQSQQCQKMAQQITVETRATLDHWNLELDRARNWLSRAQNREAAARGEVARCESAVSWAESNLSSAINELQAARNRTEYAGKDSNGNNMYRPINTSSYEAAVDAARDELAHCRNELAIAESELAAAVVERQAAQHRVDACTNAVRIAVKAGRQAKLANAKAMQALGASERAGEEQNRLENTAKHATETVDLQNEALEKLTAHFKDAQAFEGNAQASFAEAESNHNDARHRSTQGRLETELRLNRLRAFDAPIDFA